MTRPERAGQIVPLRRVEERRAASSDLSDEALLAACGVGDTAALGALFDRHHEAIYRLISRLLRTDASEIDDLVQQTFLAAWRAAKKFSSRGAVRSYLFGIAANTVRHHIRSSVRRRAALADIPPPPAAHPPDAATARAQELHRLAIALEQLPDDLRIVYVMCELEEVPGVEAARALGLRAGTLGRRLHEARRALREAIEGGTR
ncbi:MAG: RNA polymerase sigma factor [Deltaproteobacteria bacterium]|nr:RNA polymerase sigma factor [Deltaproteobacteria bacterium]